MFKIRILELNCWHDEKFEIRNTIGSSGYLFLFIKTKAVFRLDGKDVITEPNTLILFDIYTPHYYHAFEKEYIDNWMVFESDEEIRFPMNTPIYVGNALDIDGYMHLAYRAHNRGNDISCCMLINAMFSEAASIIAKEKAIGVPYADRLLPMRYELYAHPEREWTIKSMAEVLYVSETYFQQLYKNIFGISCGADIIAARVRRGMSLLCETRKSITEIARLCGYNSPAHFARQFKLAAGVTPTEYRKSKLTLMP